MSRRLAASSRGDGLVPRDAASWACVLTGPALRRRAADAYGVAYVQDKDGPYHWYDWEVAVTLR